MPQPLLEPGAWAYIASTMAAFQSLSTSRAVATAERIVGSLFGLTLSELATLVAACDRSWYRSAGRPGLDPALLFPSGGF